MKSWAGVLLLTAALPAAAQLTPIPWHPKGLPTLQTTMPGATDGLKKGAPSKKKAAAAATAAAAKAKPQEPPKYHMTFDKLTTLSPGVYVAEGNVRFEKGEMLLTADSVTYDSEKETLWATGQVAVDWGDFTVSGTELHYDMKAGTGEVRDAYGVQRDGDFTIYGPTLRKTGEDWYEVDDGTFTSCAAAVPPWSLRMSRGRFHIDHYAFLSNPRFRARQAPILYLPYLIWPIKPDRSTGFLIPEIGTSTTKGFTVNSAFFIAPADWWDDTVYLDGYEKLGWGIGEEFRYVPSENTYGWFHGYYIRQKTDDRKRWDFTWTHLQKMRNGWTFTADLNLLSDIDFPREYQRDYNQGTVSGTDSRIFLTRNWGPYAFNLRAERQRQYFTRGQDLIQSALPGAEFRSSLQPLFAGFYGGFETSAAYLHKEWGDTQLSTPTKHAISYGRVDLHPFAERPFHPAPWLDLSPRLDLRATGYGESLNPDAGTYDGGSLLRAYAKASLDLSGPRLYRRFKSGDKHVIEPYLAYTFVSRDSTAFRLPIYDEVDTVPLDQSVVRVGIRNRLYTKQGDLLFDADLYQSHSFKTPLSWLDGQANQNSPVTLLLRAWPTARWSADLRLRFNVISHALDSESLAVTYRPKKDEDGDFVRLAYLRSQTLGVTQFQPRSIAPPAQEVRLAAGLSLAGGRVTLNPHIARDLLTAEWRDLRLVFWYHGSCYAIGFDVGKRTIGPFRDTQYRFLISLKGAGTVVDLMGGTGTYGP